METFLIFAAEVIAGITFTTVGAYFAKNTGDSRAIYLLMPCVH